jgi:hypothetical protein
MPVFKAAVASLYQQLAGRISQPPVTASTDVGRGQHISPTPDAACFGNLCTSGRSTMNSTPFALNRTLAAMAVSSLLAACGGGTAEPPPDTVAPTLTITDDTSGATATGAVTFTFTFSEDVGSSFVAEDVLVAGGTAGTLTKVSETVYTLAVTPAENAAGTLSVTVAASKVSDLSNNQSTAEASGSQAFDTRVATPPVVVEGTVVANFDDVNPTVAGYEGGDGSAVEASPDGGTGNSFKVLRSGGNPWALGIVDAVVPLTSDRRVMSARVYSPTAGIRMVVKLETADAATNAGEIDANETVVEGWQTLTWTFTGADVSKTWARIVLLPNLGTVDAAPGKAYYFDDLVLLPASTGGSTGGSGGSASALTFSSGFAEGNLTVEGGAFGGFSGSNLDSFACNGEPANCGGGGGFAPGTAAADSYFYYYYQTATPATNLYAGIYVMAPGLSALSTTADTSGIQVNGQTKLKFTFNQNPEWFNSTTNNFLVDMDLGKLYLVGGNACHLQLRRVVTPTAVSATTYSIDLSSFALVQDCGGAVTSVAAALAASPISQINFKALGGEGALSDGTRISGANLSVLNTEFSVYPSTLALKGAITLE